MKKVLVLLIIAVMASACKKTYVKPNKTIIVNLSAGNWAPVNGGTSYVAEIDVPELDDYVNERGGVLVYISFGNRTYEQIPQVYNGDAFSFVTRPGQIDLEVQRSNGIGTVTPPGTMTVKIVLIPSEF